MEFSAGELNEEIITEIVFVSADNYIIDDEHTEEYWQAHPTELFYTFSINDIFYKFEFTSSNSTWSLSKVTDALSTVEWTAKGQHLSLLETLAETKNGIPDQYSNPSYYFLISCVLTSPIQSSPFLYYLIRVNDIIQKQFFNTDIRWILASCFYLNENNELEYQKDNPEYSDSHLKYKYYFSNPNSIGTDILNLSYSNDLSIFFKHISNKKVWLSNLISTETAFYAEQKGDILTEPLFEIRYFNKTYDD